MALDVHLPTDLEAFARRCVESGRYGDVGDVVRAGLRLLKSTEEERARFAAMLDAAEAEGERDGFLSLEAIAGEMDAIIDGATDGADSQRR